ncbi:MAG: bactofilin family protein [Rubrobacteraceae bacterium]
MCVLIAANPAYAFQSHALGDVVVPKGEIVSQASSMAGGVTVNGRVTGNVRSAGGDIEINGPVGGNVDSGMGNIRIRNQVGGNVNAGMGNVDINSRVGGNVDVGHGDLHLGSDAIVSGNVRHDGPFSEERGAVVEGNKVGDTASGFDRGARGGMFEVLGLAGWVLTTFVFVACSVLVAVLAPRQLSSAVRGIEVSPGRSLLFGVASVPAIIILAAVFAISIVGIPVLLLLIPAYLAFVFFGALVAAFYLGRRVLFATGRYRGGNALAAVVGAVVISIAYLIPYVGSGILYLLALLGTGATILALLSWRRNRPEHVPPYQEPLSSSPRDG